ncbi:hypothetical protein GEMRC1_001175 [Eukaryota sp. GEM-RC1]
MLSSFTRAYGGLPLFSMYTFSPEVTAIIDRMHQLWQTVDNIVFDHLFTLISDEDRGLLFSSIEPSSIRELFNYKTYADRFHFWFGRFTNECLSSIPLTNLFTNTIQTSLNDNSSAARHLLLLGSMTLVRRILNQTDRHNDIKELPGSNYTSDSYRDFSYKQLSKIIHFASIGKVIVLSSQQNIIGALFDLLNRNYIKTNRDKLGIARIALGHGANSTISVDPKTRVVIVSSMEELKDLPSALLNRMEKINLFDMYSSSLSPQDQENYRWYYRVFGLHLINGLDFNQFVTEAAVLGSESHFVQMCFRLQVPLNSARMLSQKTSYENRLKSYNVTLGGFMSLDDVIEYHVDNVPQHGPFRILVFSSHFCEPRAFSRFPHGKFIVVSVSPATCNDELDELLSSEVTEIKNDSTSLLMIVITNDELVHLPTVSSLVFSLDLKCHVAVLVINGHGSYVSPLDRFSLYFADAICYPKPLIHQVSEASNFKLGKLQSGTRTAIIHELICRCLRTYRISHQKLYEISRFFVHYLFDEGNQSQLESFVRPLTRFINSTIPDSQKSINITDDNIERFSCLNDAVFDQIKEIFSSHMDPILNFLTSSLLFSQETPSNLLNYFNFIFKGSDALLNSLSGEFQALSEISRPSSDKYIPFGLIDSSNSLPFLYFFARLIEYAVSQPSRNSTDFITEVFQRLPCALKDELNKLDLNEYYVEMLKYWNFTELQINTFFQSSQLDSILKVCISVCSAIDDMTTRISRSVCNQLNAQFNNMNTTDFVILAGHLLAFNGTSPSVLAEGLLRVRPLSETPDLSLILLTWLRTLYFFDWDQDLISSSPITEIDDVISWITSSLESRSEVSASFLSLLASLLHVLPSDFLLNPNLLLPLNVDHVRVLSHILFNQVVKQFVDQNGPLSLANFTQLQHLLSDFLSRFESNTQLLSTLFASLSCVLDEYLESSDESFEVILQGLVADQSNYIGVLFFSKLFFIKVKQFLEQDRHLPTVAVERCLSVSDSWTYLMGVSTCLPRFLSRTKYSSEVIEILKNFIENCRGQLSEAQVKSLLDSINSSLIKFKPVVYETDWLSDDTFTQLLESGVSDQSINYDTLRLWFASQISVSIPPSVTRVFTCFNDCTHCTQYSLLVPIIEMFSCPTFSFLINCDDLNNFYLPAMWPHHDLAKFFFGEKRIVKYLRYCPHCFTPVPVGIGRDCPDFVSESRKRLLVTI